MDKVEGTSKNWNFASFDEAIEYAADAIGSDFAKAVALSLKIAENPNDYTGPQAKMAAMKLAANRVKIGIACQVWKQTATATKKPHDRLIKDALMCIYDSLLELINTLKIAAKDDRELVNAIER